MDHQFPSLPKLLSSFLIIFILLKLWKKSKSPQSTPNLPPGPWKLPLIGNIHHLSGSLPHHSLRNLAKKYGPLMHLQLGELSTIVVSSPEIAKEVMKTHDAIFASRPFVLAVSVLTYGFVDIVFSPYGDYWRQMRKIFAMELLSSKRVASFRSIREEEVAKLVRTISSNAGSVINLSKEIFSLTICITSRAAFGEKLKDREQFACLIQDVMKLAGGFSLPDLFPSFSWLQDLTGMMPKVHKIHQKLDMIVDDIISEHKVKRATSKEGNDERIEDFVDVLLKLQEDGEVEFPLADDNIKAVISDIFAAGTDTSSTTLEWAMSELLKNPRVMNKAQAEVRQVFSENGGVDETRLHELKYLKLVVKETLRLRPPVPLLIPRECRESCVIDGYTIPAKSKVIVNGWAIGRDQNYWDEAEKFYPERFLDSTVDFRGLNFEFVPFGAGRRICPGLSFGVANVELPLANLLYHFDWKSPDGTRLEDLNMDENFGITVRRKRDLLLVPIPYQPRPQLARP